MRVHYAAGVAAAAAAEHLLATVVATAVATAVFAAVVVLEGSQVTVETAVVRSMERQVLVAEEAEDQAAGLLAAAWIFLGAAAAAALGYWAKGATGPGGLILHAAV